MYDVNHHLMERPMRVVARAISAKPERILEAAGRLFREHGFDQVGVADVMRAAGLTHGGFYGHFKSKDDLIAQVAAQASDKTLERWRAMGQAQGAAALKSIATPICRCSIATGRAPAAWWRRSAPRSPGSRRLRPPLRTD